MADESMRDVFPHEWMGTVEYRLGNHQERLDGHDDYLGRHDGDLAIVRELIGNLATEQKNTRDELGKKIDRVVRVIEITGRAIMILVGIVGVLTPMVMLALALKDVI